MSTPLDTILSAGREAAPPTEQETTTQPEKEQAEQTTEQTTDADGGHTAQGSTAADGKPVPVGAIRQAEREKATKRYTEQVADFEAKQAERDAAWERRFTKLLETVKPPPQPQQAPDFYENPPGAVLHTMAPVVTELRNSMLHNSRLIAEQRHNEDVVKAADDAFSKAVGEGKLTPADPEFQQVINSPNIFDAAVRWHRRIQAQAEIGDDPAAYKAKLEAEIRAKLEAEAQPDAQTNGAQRQQVMPSNLAAARNVGSRSGPQWGGPQPIGAILDQRRDIFKR